MGPVGAVAALSPLPPVASPLLSRQNGLAALTRRRATQRLFRAVLTAGPGGGAAARTPVRPAAAATAAASAAAADAADDALCRFGWSLFCLAKHRLLGAVADLAASVHLLVVRAPSRQQLPARARAFAPKSAHFAAVAHSRLI